MLLAFCIPGFLPASPERLSLSRWPHGREHLEVAGVCVCVCVCLKDESTERQSGLGRKAGKRGEREGNRIFFFLFLEGIIDFWLDF